MILLRGIILCMEYVSILNYLCYNKRIDIE